MIDCFDHADNIVHIGKTIVQKGAHVVKDGIFMLLLLGIPPKLIFCLSLSLSCFLPHTILFCPLTTSHNSVRKILLDIVTKLAVYSASLC